MSEHPEPSMSRVDALGRHDAWDGVHALVLGIGASGFAAADNLMHLGAQVTVLDESTDADAGVRGERATLLEILGADVRLGLGSTATLPESTDVVVTSAGWPPAAAPLEQVRGAGIPVWGEVDLAWRLRDANHPAPWLAVTGAAGTATTGRMLDYVLRAHGLRSVVCGQVGLPLVEAVMDPTPHEVVVVALTALQLHYTEAMAAESAVVLEVGDQPPADYTSLGTYLADQGRVYQRVRRACVYNVADPMTERLVREADVEEGARAIGLTLGPPGVGMVGVVDGVLADRAFIDDRGTSAAELCTVADLASDAPRFVTDALAAAALARAHGVPPVAVRNGLRAFEPQGGDGEPDV